MVQLEYECGPLTVNFRSLLEPKGFLRIIIAFIALLAFATTAGFNSSSDGNSVSCLGGNNTNYTGYITFGYPFSSGSYDNRFSPMNEFTINNTNCSSFPSSFSQLALSGSAQFFVAMGILTILYVIGAVLVYLLFITPELFMAKWLVIGDFILTIVFGVLYLLACIAWSAGAAQLNSYVNSRLSALGTTCFWCASTDPLTTPDRAVQTFAQPAISLIFGYLATFIWFASIWFVYKDTVWHKDKTGPLAALYGSKDEEGGGEGGEAPPSKESQQEGGE